MYCKIKSLANNIENAGFKEEANLIRKLAKDTTDAEDITDEDVIIATLLGEASVDGTEGMRAVYSVIKNRAKHKGQSLKNIVLEPKQFSMWNDKSTEKQIKDYINKMKKSKGMWETAKRIVRADPGDTALGSTHYYTGSTPYWASEKNPCWIPRIKVGSHIFGIDFSISWVNPGSLPSDIIKAYLQEGRKPARCYKDRPKRYPPKL